MSERWILQLCHCHYGPFADVARQWASLFHGTNIRVTTVYLTGEASEEVARISASDEVHFMEFSSKEVGGLKLSAIRKLRALLQQHPYETIIAHRFKPIFIACWGSRLPVIGVHHAFGDYQRLSHKLFARWFKPRLNLVGVSNAVRDDIRSCLSGMEDRVHTFYNHIDVDQVRSEVMSRDAARTHLDLPQDAWVVGNVGRLHPDKDQATLIRGFARALPQLPEGALLVIVGEGRLKQELKEEAVRQGVAEQVRFLGQVPHARSAFSAFDVFALTSDHEPFGMVLLEAMAAEVPVTASNSGGAPEVIDDSHALFPLKDDSSVAQRLVEFAALTDARRAALVRHQLQCLDARFSDEAARRVFFGNGLLNVGAETETG